MFLQKISLASVGHRAIEEDRNVRQPARGFQPLKVKQQALRPPDGKGRNDHRAAAADRIADNLRQGVCRIALVVPTVAIGRFDHEIVGTIDRYRIDHGGVIVSAEIAGEDDRGAGPIELDGGCAEDVPGAPQPDRASARQWPILFKGNRRQVLGAPPAHPLRCRAASAGLCFEKPWRFAYSASFSCRCPASGSRIAHKSAVAWEQKMGPRKPRLTNSGK